MEKDWVRAYDTQQEYIAELARAVLSDNDIESVVINKKDSSYHFFGDIEIYVKRDNILRAKLILKQI
ncbi:MAG: DUF2007 domain-containing protein [Bacteroidetes bacterium]|nr:DUF2007 domain-containing protein [Bacteroidota bacterium]